MDPQKLKPKPLRYLVNLTSGEEFELFKSTLKVSSVIAMDCEWDPKFCLRDTRQIESKGKAVQRAARKDSARKADNLKVDKKYPPTVCLLQVTCHSKEDAIFLVDLVRLPLHTIWELLKDAFTSINVLKLGFKFKQDLINLSSTFLEAEGCEQGFDKVTRIVWSPGDHVIMSAEKKH